MGAKKYDRVKELYRKILTCSLVIGLLFTIVFELAPDFVVGLFGTPTNIPNPEDYWEFGRKTMQIFMSLISISCLIKMNSIFFQAVGKPVQATIASMIRDIVCFVPLVLILPAAFSNVEAILYAAPISDVIAMVVTAFLSVSFIRSLKNVESKDTTPAVLKPSAPGMIITIAREHGSSGKQIGNMVAEKLGIPFYYKEMTALAAQECGLDKEFIAEINTNSPSVLHSLYLSTDVIQMAVAAQDKVIRKIADQGSCVIVGRAADYVLREYDNVFRVFVYAPDEFKIKRIMEVYGDSYDEAKKNVRRSDEARSHYYKQISGLSWGDKHNYDLVINSEIGLENTADVIAFHVKQMLKNK